VELWKRRTGPTKKGRRQMKRMNNMRSNQKR
jgi:hypothetical protein